ncbi:sigma factor-like helix-turn-helix DNA-binding protein [Holdemania massiliensis]|uniref:sigma factor-like helix-turn-helix DNA-binding protein n=1 Tax=Holdemania massiliensis TaxID=1468449 RepID=UPI003563D889
MATLAERKEYLENELRSYRYIVDQCYRWEQSLADAEVAMAGISSPHAKEVIYENAGNPYECKYNSLYEDIKKAKAQLLMWQPRRQWIENRLGVLTQEEYQAIKYYYMLKQSQDWIASVLKIGRRTVQRRIDKALEKMLNF